MSKADVREKARQAIVETRMVASTAMGLFAGRTVWVPKEPPPDTAWVGQARKRNLAWARDSYHERLRSESDGIEAVRRRAEFALTAIIAAMGLSTAAFEKFWGVAAGSIGLIAIWAFGVLAIVVAILVFAGVAVSKKVLGIVQVPELTSLEDPRRAELCQYVLAVDTTSKTRRALVTVFRDGFLIALLGLTLLATAHTVAWVVSTDAASVPVIINIIGPARHP